MPLTLSGTNGVSGIDGSNTTPAVRGGTSSSNGVFYGTNTVSIATNSTTAVSINSSQIVDISKDALINGLTVGKGAGAISTNTATGVSALSSNTTGATSVAVGYQASFSQTTAQYSVSVGYQAGYSNQTGTGATGNVCVGYQAGYSNTSQDNTYIGGYAAGNATSGGGNVAIGFNAGSSAATSIFNISTNSDRVVIGSTNTSNAYVKVAWTVTSDARDKTDISDVTYGLSFINYLRPVTFVWDERSNYENGIPDGSKKKAKRQIGFLAQDVIALEKSLGATDKNLLIADDEENERLKITETKIIPALVKAIQELSAKNDALEARIAALEAK